MKKNVILALVSLSIITTSDCATSRLGKLAAAFNPRTFLGFRTLASTSRQIVAPKASLFAATAQRTAVLPRITRQVPVIRNFRYVTQSKNIIYFTSNTFAEKCMNFFGFASARQKQEALAFDTQKSKDANPEITQEAINEFIFFLSTAPALNNVEKEDMGLQIEEASTEVQKQLIEGAFRAFETHKGTPLCVPAIENLILVLKYSDQEAKKSFASRVENLDVMPVILERAKDSKPS